MKGNNLINSKSQEAPKPAVMPVDVWFDDGNLIIQAEDKLFHVYRGILSSASSILRNMLLSLPVTDESGTFDGCQVVHIPDSAAD